MKEKKEIVVGGVDLGYEILQHVAADCQLQGCPFPLVVIRKGADGDVCEPSGDEGKQDEDRSTKHGTLSTYKNLRCRCDQCKEANRIYSNEKRIRDRKKRG